MLSILTPAFNESTNLEALYARIVQTMAQIGAEGEWEWLVIDDHSRDDTFEVIVRLARADPHVRGIRLARNSGSHVAIACGLHHVRGQAAVMMASDLQDPPETLGALLERWRAGAQIVWAVRRARPGDRSHAGFAAVYYWIMRNVVGMTEMPERGADFFLIDKQVVEAFRRFPERNLSVFALLTSLGFSQEYIEYDKQPRAAGRSGWTIARKIKLVVDSVTGFSDAPIRLCTYAGVVIFGLGLLLGLVRLAGSMRSSGVVLAAMCVLTGIQLLALGIVGEYVWRALDEARRRPAYLIERYVGVPVSDVRSPDARG
jgi:glycosyltransferase involved in cell wall biosynthesis